MAFSIELEASFVADVDGTPVVGRVRILSAAERLNYSSAHTGLQDGTDVEAIVLLVDQWASKVLVECDATVGGLVYSKCDPETQKLYVAHMPMQAKEALIKTALGISELEGGSEGNSEAGPVSD
jgi:hypothetical protein